MFRLFLFILFFPLFAFSNTISVCKDCPVSSIKQAISIAHNGDIIIIKKGTYKEGQIIINKEIQFLGDNFPIIDGENKTEIITVEADNVTIKGFQIQNVGTSYIKDRAGIKVESQRNCIIENNKLLNTFFGIYLAKSQNCTIKDNTIIGTAVEELTSGNAIHLWYCNNIQILNNVSEKHRDGIYLEFVSDSKIKNNISKYNVRYGMHFMFSDNNEYYQNKFIANSAGVAVMFSKNITMSENLFADNWGASSYGILLKEIKDSYIIKNTFKSNTIGLYAEGANRNIIKNNTFELNGWAITVMGNCEDNYFTENNFLTNTFEITTNTKYNYNRFEKNFWSKYSGYDLNKDGIGDIPHNPVNLFSYIVEHNPTSLILIRSFFMDVLNFAEQITPILTPETINDKQPLTHRILW